MDKKIDVSRALRDEEYYLSLTEEQRASLGAHPSGLIELGQTDLRTVSGGGTLANTCTCACTPCGHIQCCA
jgi:mersacidin/lichenicidin family type 2 lantibiotic